MSNRAFSKGLVPHVCHAPKNLSSPDGPDRICSIACSIASIAVVSVAPATL